MKLCAFWTYEYILLKTLDNKGMAKALRKILLEITFQITHCTITNEEMLKSTLYILNIYKINQEIRFASSTSRYK